MSGSTISTSETKLEALHFQSSAYGGTLPVVYGVTRIAGNLIWYNGFKSIARTETQSSGKGGGVKTQNTTFTYTANMIMALCEGSISGVAQSWRGKNVYQGGPSPTQINTTTQTFVYPGGGGSVTVTNSATYSANLGVYSPGGGGDDGANDYYLAEGSQFTHVGGVYTFPDNPTLTGRTLTIAYQYLSGGATQSSLQQLGLSLAQGNVGQSVWTYLGSTYPAQAVAYSGVAYVYAQAYSLGSDASVENHNFEVQAQFAYHLGSTVPDVDASMVGYDMLTNQRYGVNFPAVRSDSNGDWSAYCRAAGLLMSPAFTEQMEAAELLKTLAQLTNTGIVWSEGLLKFIPYGDTTLTGNGAAYTPNLTPIYDLDDAVYLDKENPVKLMRKPQVDAYNHVSIEFLNRANGYNVEIAEAKDQANIDTYGLRSADVIRAHWICDAAVARLVCQLLLQRSLYIRNTYEFKLPWNYALLEPMDLVTVSDDNLQLVKVPVRITSVTEAEDGELSFTAEDFPLGVANASLYGSQSGSGFQHNYNVSPGSISTPVIFEAPAQQTENGLEILVAARGAGANWGGCNVWVSLDGSSYRLIGTITGGSRYGALTAAISGGNLPVSVIGGQLLSGSVGDANALTTLCYIGGANKEFLAYTTATLTGANAYTLSGLIRGAYNSSSASAHGTGDSFVRINEAVARSGMLDLSYIGKTIYFKFTSFNVFGGGEESLASVTAYTYVPTGWAAQLLPGIGGKGVSLVADYTVFDIDENGVSTPATITLTALLKGTLAGNTVWTISNGTATLVGTGNSRTIAASSLTTPSVTVTVSVTDPVATYTDYITLSKTGDGAAFYALVITVYAQAATQPTAPVGGSYTFTGDVFVAPAGTSRSMPTSTTTPSWASVNLFETTTPWIPVSGPTSTDPSLTGVLLLSHFDGPNASTVFTDVGGSPARTLTAVSGAKVSTAQSQWGGSSLLLNGTSDYVSVPASTDFNFGTGDFTLEAWVYLNGNSPVGTGGFRIGTIVGCDARNTGWAMSLNISSSLNTGSGGLVLETKVAGVGSSASGNIPLVFGQWYHVAVSKKGATVSYFVNGDYSGGYVNTQSISTSSAMTIGANTQGSTYFYPLNGYIDDLRVTKGVARYAPTPYLYPLFKLLNPGVGSAGGDPYWRSTAILLHMDGSAGGTTFTDSSTFARTPSSVVNATTSAGQVKFGTTAGGFSATSAGVYYATSTSLDMPGDFTLEAWVYRTATAAFGQYICVRRVFDATGTGTWRFGTTAFQDLQTLAIPVTYTVPLNAWTHVAVSRAGSTVRAFINGVLVSTGTSTTNFTSTNQMIVGRDWDSSSNTPLGGFIDDLRITVGVARYTVDFTPSAVAHPDVEQLDPYSSSVQLLLHMEGTSGSTSFPDSSSFARTVTATGALVQTAVSKWGNGSGYFDGVNSYLSVPYSAGVDFSGGGDFTIEAYTYWMTSTAFPTLLDFRGSGTIASSWAFAIDSANRSLFIYDGPSAIAVTGTQANAIPAANTWFHWALVKKGSKVMIFVNGAQCSTTSYTPPATNATGLRIGNAYDLVYDFKGYIQDLRFTKGATRYSATSFEAPTGPFPDLYGSGGWSPFVKVYQDGAAGATLSLSFTSQAFTYDASNTAVPSSQTITFTANLSGGLTGTATFVCTLYNSAGTSLGTVTLGGSGNTRTLTNTQFLSLGAAQNAVVVASLSGYSDTATVVKLKDGATGAASITGLLSNESTTVSADSAGTVSDFSTAGGTFRVWNGTADVTGTTGPVTYSVNGTPTGGLSISIASTGIYTVTALTADHGTATLRAVYGGVTIDKLFDISKSKSGAAGTSTIVLNLVPETSTVPADSTGYVASYSTAVTTIAVMNGNTDDTSLWALSVTSGPGVTASLISNQASISDMTSDTGYVQVTATRSGFTTLTKRFNVVKARSAGTSAGAQAPGFSAFATGSSPAIAGIQFRSDGTVGIRQNKATTYTTSGNWFVPTTTGTGSSYWIKVTPRSGYTGASAGTSGAWVSLASTQTYSEVASSPGDDLQSVMDYEISNSSSGTPVAATGGVLDIHAVY
jgi:hypothetical protein